jgi:hypothetical protein
VTTPVTTTVNCSSLLHAEPRSERPTASYQLHAMPCRNRGCEGRICAGHPLCPACVAEVRAGRTWWIGTAEAVDVVLVATL